MKTSSLAERALPHIEFLQFLISLIDLYTDFPMGSYVGR